MVAKKDEAKDAKAAESAKNAGSKPEATKAQAKPEATKAQAKPDATKAQAKPDADKGAGEQAAEAKPGSGKAKQEAPKQAPADKPETKPAAAKGEPQTAATKPEAKPAAKSEAKPDAKPAPEPTGDYAMLRDAHASDVVKFEVPEDGVGVLQVTRDGLQPIASEAKAMGYTLLSLLSSYDRGDHFGTLYALVKPAASPAEFAELRLRVTMPKKDEAGNAVEPSCPSLVPVFPAADWQEREMYDMYGIRFVGHPDLRRMFLPEGWSGYPMRKDSKEPEQYVAMRDGEDIVVKSPEEGAW
jgi:NADH:ubiquinone oxidoreductase subunit C